ncbi:MAG: bifunctional UDP-N-acetylglucosamine diphosphorylase/glucosamine-1-phosphate N-acetyltransferase GlmU [Clostridium sp.]|nr:bifunctional UDP-N-acetylglucosamine diphosphorylase/glucosamine-1-phosphate N-acetyltransferase GlmU [Clostridium sp.]
MEHSMALILAAGEGTRMKSRKAKVLHEICGMSLLEWVHHSVKKAGIKKTVVVVGHKAEEVKEKMGDQVGYAFQKEQLGTGHAVMQAQDHINNNEGHILVLCGDTPLISSETISEAVNFHKTYNNSATIITAEFQEPDGYGRIVRDESGAVKKIVEHKDAKDDEKNIKEINSGMYCFNAKDLKTALAGLSNNNSQGEYYLTDTIEILLNGGKNVGAYKVGDNKEVLGINDRVQLAYASGIIKNKILENIMRNGATIIDPTSTYIDWGAKVGADTVIYPSTFIRGKTQIGENCTIGPGTTIEDCKIACGARIINSVVCKSIVDENTNIGPFAYIRPGSHIGREVKIGDFVEIKKSKIGDGTKISHLTYVGDAEIGKNVNLGCGVVVVNYDGQKKNKTVVGDNSFVGCNVNLISPVEVGDNAYVAAGSTITDSVPENSLAIARERQIIKADWVTKRGTPKKGK